MQSDNEKTADVAKAIKDADDAHFAYHGHRISIEYATTLAKAALAAMPKVSEEELAESIAAAAFDGENMLSEKRARHIARLVLARLPQIRKANEWQPIESAPKDGTPILCTSKNELGKWRRYIAFYAQPYTLPNGDDNFIDDESEFAPEGWYTDTSDEERVNLCKPTFWMPLPLPPTTAKE